MVQPRSFAMGNDLMEFPGPDLAELRDSSGLLDQPQALRQRLEDDGYLFIRGLHDRAKVLAARAEMIANLDRLGAIDRQHPLDEARLAPGYRGGLGGAFEGTEATRNQVLRGARVMGFFDRLLGASAMTFDFQWVRAVPPGDGTGAHYDIVYMGRGTPNLFTCWTPYGQVPPELGGLAVCVGSHRLPGWRPVQDTYGRIDVDRDALGGWFSHEPRRLTAAYGGQWATTTFEPGDALIFGMFTMHMSLRNATDRIRLSSDTRYQRHADPVDERWVAKAGGVPPGHTPGFFHAPQDSIERLKSAWALPA